ncbi:MAG: hypothetical protein KF724_00230 [Phycisphaeraceae bacterium]|nr:hypothetical protein [Phycisphaeraceae bacterium]
MTCSLAYFALVLFGYFLLRPVREAMGVARSMDDLRWLFVVTCGASLVVALAFGGVVARLDRARCIVVGQLGVAACLVVFVPLRLLVDESTQVVLGYCFYVWLSVVNLFLTAIFWAFMADVWSLEQSKRLFPVIAVGGTLGALGGSWFASRLVDVIGASGQMVIAAACFVVTVLLVLAIDRVDRRITRTAAHPVGGSWGEGATRLVRSPYLLGTALFVIFLTISSTLLYFTRAELVVDARRELEARIALFARMDAWTQGATLVMQLFVTGQLIRRLGIGWTLAVLPMVTVSGFGVLAWMQHRGVEGWQLFAAVTAFSAVHSAVRFAIARPTRETLFTVVEEADRYKVKPVIDLFVYRGGDVAGAWLTALVAGMWGMLMLALPLGAIWGGMSLWLAVAQRRRAADRRDRDGPPSQGVPSHTLPGVLQ